MRLDLPEQFGFMNEKLRLVMGKVDQLAEVSTVCQQELDSLNDQAEYLHGSVKQSIAAAEAAKDKAADLELAAQEVETQRQNEAQQSFSDMDADGDGKLSLDEFVKAYPRAIFRAIDKDGSGEITAKEFGSCIMVANNEKDPVLEMVQSSIVELTGQVTEMQVTTGKLETTMERENRSLKREIETAAEAAANATKLCGRLNEDFEHVQQDQQKRIRAVVEEATEATERAMSKVVRDVGSTVSSSRDQDAVSGERIERLERELVKQQQTTQAAFGRVQEAIQGPGGQSFQAQLQAVMAEQEQLKQQLADHGSDMDSSARELLASSAKIPEEFERLRAELAQSEKTMRNLMLEYGGAIAAQDAKMRDLGAECGGMASAAAGSAQRLETAAQQVEARAEYTNNLVRDAREKQMEMEANLRDGERERSFAQERRIAELRSMVEHTKESSTQIQRACEARMSAVEDEGRGAQVNTERRIAAMEREMRDSLATATDRQQEATHEVTRNLERQIRRVDEVVGTRVGTQVRELRESHEGRLAELDRRVARNAAWLASPLDANTASRERAAAVAADRALDLSSSSAAAAAAPALAPNMPPLPSTVGK